jgi:cellulose synthase/poly-beta-1,6-N-acetylglucosamine synthase-like glycosyltransferase
MIEFIALSSLIIFTCYYAYFIIRARIGLLSLSYGQQLDVLPFVSVIIAARNEESTIGHCIESLLQQTYPPSKYEIIIVDDHSADKTTEKVISFANIHSNIRLYSLSSQTEDKLHGKTNAITYGINKSNGEIVFTTDADCLVQPKWVEIMVSHFTKDVAFVAGPVKEQNINSFFSKLESLELLGLITIAAGLIGSKRPIICNGANLGYRKSVFISAGGFGNVQNSNDDESLMNRILVQKLGKIKFAPEAEAVVITKSSNTIISFLRQRIRWANKRGHYEDKSILVSLIALYFFFLSVFIIAFLGSKNIQLLIPLIIAFCAKMVVDIVTLRAGAKLFNQTISVFHFLIAELLHVPYIVIAAAIGQLTSLKWKGRSI